MLDDPSARPGRWFAWSTYWVGDPLGTRAANVCRSGAGRGFAGANAKAVRA